MTFYRESRAQGSRESETAFNFPSVASRMPRKTPISRCRVFGADHRYPAVERAHLSVLTYPVILHPSCSDPMQRLHTGPRKQEMVANLRSFLKQQRRKMDEVITPHQRVINPDVSTCATGISFAFRKVIILRLASIAGKGLRRWGTPASVGLPATSSQRAHRGEKYCTCTNSRPDGNLARSPTRPMMTPATPHSSCASRRAASSRVS